MKYFITEEQLDRLKTLSWGAKFTSAPEMEKFVQLLAQIKTQRL